MTYGTSAYDGFIDTGRARENRAERRSRGRAPVPGPTGTLPAASRAGGCRYPQARALPALALGDKTS